MKTKNIIIIVLVIILIIGGYFIFKDKLLKPVIKIESENNLGLKFPFELSSEQINQSLNTKEAIIIEPVVFEWEDIINKSLSHSGWQLLSIKSANDGGSNYYSYFKSKDIPAIELSYKWDMFEGKNKYISINFINIADINSWLMKIKQEPEYFNVNHVDIDSLLYSVENPSQVTNN